jgi:hypothetical protein
MNDASVSCARYIRKTLPTRMGCYFCWIKPKVMRNIFLLIISAVLFSCGNKTDGPKPFCVAPCQQDTIKFKNEAHALQPYLYISASNCEPDSVIWSYKGLGTNRKLSFSDFGGHKFKLNTSYMSCVLNDTSFAWLLFNDCSNGRGYFAKIPFNKKLSITRKGSAFNKFDPKYAVADGMVAYTDKGNIFVEEMATGKQAMMTFGNSISELDYDAMHEYIDSVNITPTRIWAKIRVGKDWKQIEKNITLKLP